MPLPKEVRVQVLDYCDRDLPKEDSAESFLFDFIADSKLRERVEAEFKAARFIYTSLERL